MWVAAPQHTAQQPMDEEPQDDGARLVGSPYSDPSSSINLRTHHPPLHTVPACDVYTQTELADFWLYEHLLSLPKSIATDEIINHLGSKYPFRHGEGASLPAPISARLFLRHLREPPQLPVTDWEEQLQLLGLMCQLSCKHEQFQSRQAAAAMHPPSELMVEVCRPAAAALGRRPVQQAHGSLSQLQSTLLRARQDVDSVTAACSTQVASLRCAARQAEGVPSHQQLPCALLLLCPQVLMQLLCTRADPAFSAEPDEQGEQQQPLTSAAVASVAEELLSNADVEYLQDDEQLQNRCGPATCRYVHGL